VTSCSHALFSKLVVVEAKSLALWSIAPASS
jgi:hypothetical protein